jgi:hypothetical protein
LLASVKAGTGGCANAVLGLQEEVGEQQKDDSRSYNYELHAANEATVVLRVLYIVVLSCHGHQDFYPLTTRGLELLSVVGEGQVHPRLRW